MFIDDSVKDSGRFLFWSWELWQIGGGGGVQWKFLKWEIDPGQHSLLWVIFDWQRKSDYLLNNVLKSLYTKMKNNTVDIDPEINEMVNDNFWDLID